MSVDAELAPMASSYLTRSLVVKQDRPARVSRRWRLVNLRVGGSARPAGDRASETVVS